MTTASKSDPRELLRRSFAQSASVIAGVTPDEMELSTPCTAFDVRALIGHMLFAADRIKSAGLREPLAEGTPTVTGLTDDEWAAAFDKAAAEALSAWSVPGALAGDVVLPFGTFPSPVVVSMYSMEQVTHSWDLAVATGSSVELDSELAEAMLPLAMQMVPPEIRVGEEAPFAPVVEVAADAPPYDRLAAFLGRRPV
ncbi:MAG: TIGR03086 family metal-binding protein [Acidimicrobiales bacterium]